MLGNVELLTSNESAGRKPEFSKPRGKAPEAPKISTKSYFSPVHEFRSAMANSLASAKVMAGLRTTAGSFDIGPNFFQAKTLQK